MGDVPEDGGFDVEVAEGEEMTKKKIKLKPHRIPYESWANSQLSIAKYWGGCTLNGKTYKLDYENCRKEGDKFFPDLVEVIK